MTIAISVASQSSPFRPMALSFATCFHISSIFIPHSSLHLYTSTITTAQTRAPSSCVSPSYPCHCWQLPHSLSGQQIKPQHWLDPSFRPRGVTPRWMARMRSTRMIRGATLIVVSMLFRSRFWPSSSSCVGGVR